MPCTGDCAPDGANSGLTSLARLRLLTFAVANAVLGVIAAALLVAGAWQPGLELDGVVEDLCGLPVAHRREFALLAVTVSVLAVGAAVAQFFALAVVCNASVLSTKVLQAQRILHSLLSVLALSVLLSAIVGETAAAFITNDDGCSIGTAAPIAVLVAAWYVLTLAYPLLLRSGRVRAPPAPGAVLPAEPDFLVVPGVVEELSATSEEHHKWNSANLASELEPHSYQDDPEGASFCHEEDAQSRLVILEHLISNLPPAMFEGGDEGGGEAGMQKPGWPEPLPRLPSPPKSRQPVRLVLSPSPAGDVPGVLGERQDWRSEPPSPRPAPSGGFGRGDLAGAGVLGLRGPLAGGAQDAARGGRKEFARAEPGCSEEELPPPPPPPDEPRRRKRRRGTAPAASAATRTAAAKPLPAAGAGGAGAAAVTAPPPPAPPCPAPADGEEDTSMEQREPEPRRSSLLLSSKEERLSIVLTQPTVNNHRTSEVQRRWSRAETAPEPNLQSLRVALQSCGAVEDGSSNSEASSQEVTPAADNRSSLLLSSRGERMSIVLTQPEPVPSGASLGQQPGSRPASGHGSRSSSRSGSRRGSRRHDKRRSSRTQTAPELYELAGNKALEGESRRSGSAGPKSLNLVTDNAQDERTDVVAAQKTHWSEHWDGVVRMMTVCPIDFSRCVEWEGESSSGSETESISEDCDNSDAEEVWCNRAEGVEVPVWLLDKFKGGAKAKQALATAAPQATPIAESPISASPQKSPSQSKNVSFQLNPTTHQQSFWKIPVPTRSNTYFQAKAEAEQGESREVGPGDTVRGDGGAEVSQEHRRRARRKTSALMVPGRPEADKGTGAGVEGDVGDESDDEEMKRRMSRLKKRRPSNALSVVAGPDAPEQGLYSVPRGPDSTSRKGSASALVEVRRQSVALPSNMLRDLLGRGAKNGEETDSEIVLPFFVPTEKATPRLCKCKKDPATGLVNHTCMTPLTSAGVNTNMGSYVCTEWQTRAGTRKASRRTSDQEQAVSEADEEEDVSARSDAGEARGGADAAAAEGGAASSPSRPPPGGDGGPEAAKRAPCRAVDPRIRNVSILCLAGQAETEIEANCASPFAEEAEEENDENELLVSVSHIPSEIGGFHTCAVNTAQQAMCWGYNEYGQSDVPNGLGNALAVSAGGVDDGSVAKDTPEQHSRKDSTGQMSTPMDERYEKALAERFDMIEPAALHPMLVGRERREEVLVVDVRGRDWVGGHIPTSINLRTSEIVKKPDALLEHCKRNGKTHLVFTCMYSVLRARKCARALEHHQGSVTVPVRLSLLEGGVHAWVNHFAARQVQVSRPYIESFDPELWCDGGPSQGGLVHAMDALWSQGGAKALSLALCAELESISRMQEANVRDESEAEAST